MFELFRLIDAAAHDARRAETLMSDASSRRPLRTDPEDALLAFELRATAVGNETGEREARTERRYRGVRAARRQDALI